MDDIGLGAVRRLGVDVANVTASLAIAQSGIEYIKRVAVGIDADAWDKQMVDDDNGHPDMVVTMRGEHVDAVVRLLAAIDALS